MKNRTQKYEEEKVKIEEDSEKKEEISVLK